MADYEGKGVGGAYNAEMLVRNLSSALSYNRQPRLTGPLARSTTHYQTPEHINKSHSKP